MRKRSIFAAAGLAAATIIGAIAPSNTASAGEIPDIDVDIRLIGPDANATLSGLTLELWDITATPTLVTCAGPEATLDVFAGDLAGQAFGACDFPADGTYALGIDGIPEGMTVTGACSDFSDLIGEDRLPGASFDFTIGQQTFDIDCDVYLVQPVLLVDKIVADGDAAPGDFGIEVYDDGGNLVAEGTDTSPALCGDGLPLTNCAVIPVPAGSYQLGETGPAGYVPSNVGCVTFVPRFGLRLPLEAFPSGIGEFTLGDDPEGDAFPIAQCEITNRYYEGDLVVTKSVTNDDGGTLGPADFTAEVYTEPGGSLVASGDCNADGDCIAVTLPIGDYRIGEADPQGYTPSVTCTVTGEPDGPGDIGTSVPTTSTTEPEFNEAIPGDDAVATVEPFGEVTCEIVNDDPTTTTTLAPTTTDQGGGGAVPTTVAPILPPTGDNNGTMAIIATLLIAIGGALLVARRRIA